MEEIREKFIHEYSGINSEDQSVFQKSHEFFDKLVKDKENAELIFSFLFETDLEESFHKFCFSIASRFVSGLVKNENDEFLQFISSKLFKFIMENMPSDSNEYFKLLKIIVCKFNSVDFLQEMFNSGRELLETKESLQRNEAEIVIRILKLCFFMSSNNSEQMNTISYDDFLFFFSNVMEKIEPESDDVVKILIKLLRKYLACMINDLVKHPEPMSFVYSVLDSATEDFHVSGLVEECAFLLLELTKLKTLLKSDSKIATIGFYSNLSNKEKIIIPRLMVTDGISSKLWFSLAKEIVDWNTECYFLDPYVDKLLKICEEKAETEYSGLENFSEFPIDEIREIYNTCYDTFNENSNRNICISLFLAISNRMPKVALDYILNGESEQLLVFARAFVDVIDDMNLKDNDNFSDYVEPLVGVCHSDCETEIKEASKLELFMRMRDFRGNEDFYDYLLNNISSNEKGLVLYMSALYLPKVLREKSDGLVDISELLISRFDAIETKYFLYSMNYIVSVIANPTQVFSFLLSLWNKESDYFDVLCMCIAKYAKAFGYQEQLLPLLNDTKESPESMRFILNALLVTPLLEKAVEISKSNLDVLALSVLDCFMSDSIKSNVNQLFSLFITAFDSCESVHWPIVTVLCFMIRTGTVSQESFDALSSFLMKRKNDSNKDIYQVSMIVSAAINNSFSVNEGLVQIMMSLAESSIVLYRNIKKQLIKSVLTVVEGDEENEYYTNIFNDKQRTEQPFSDESDANEFNSSLLFFQI